MMPPGGEYVWIVKNQDELESIIEKQVFALCEDKRQAGYVLSRVAELLLKWDAEREHGQWVVTLPCEDFEAVVERAQDDVAMEWGNICRGEKADHDYLNWKERDA